MKLLKLTILCAALALSGIADAKGGMSSGGGRSSGASRGGFSGSPGRTMAGPSAAPRPNSTPSFAQNSPRPNSQPSIAPNAPGQVRPNSQPSIAANATRPNSQPSIAPNTAAATPRTTTTTTTTATTMTRRTAGGGYMGGGMMYGGMGMGYGYSNGLLTGLIIGNMMHPHNTVVYAGGGAYNNNALLYPDGRVVNQQGYQVGTYNNGQFNAVNGGMVAQQAPSDAYTSTTQAQPVVMVKTGPTWGEITMMVLVGIAVIVLVVILL